jgi:hypothetical protein
VSLATAAREALYRGELTDLCRLATDDPDRVEEMLIHAFLRGAKVGAVEIGAQIIELRTPEDS